MLWQLYLEYETSMDLTKPLNLLTLLGADNEKDITIEGAFVESSAMTDIFTTKMKIKKVTQTIPGHPANLLYKEVVSSKMWLSRDGNDKERIKIMYTVAEINYTDFNLRGSTSAQFTDDASVGLRLATEPKNRLIRYFYPDTNLVTFFVMPAVQDKQEPISAEMIMDPLAKYKALIRRIDFSEIGTEKDKMEEEMRVYLDLVDYRKRATTLFIDGKLSETQKCD